MTASEADPGESAVIELVRLLTDRGTNDLASSRAELERLATEAKLPVIRQFGFAALVAADGSADRPGRSQPARPSRCAISWARCHWFATPAREPAFTPKVEPLLNGLPAALSTGQQGGSDETRATIRRAAMNALTSIRGQEVPTFRALSKFIRENIDRHAAILALQKIPAAYWPSDEARPLLESLIAYVQQMPVRRRTSPAALDALQLGDALAALLPADAARSFRKELSSLGVRVIRVGTVLEQMRYDLDRIVVQAASPCRSCSRTST